MEKDKEITTVQQYLLAILPYQQRAFAQIHRFGSERPALLFRGKKEKSQLLARIAGLAKTIPRPIAFERERLSFMRRRLGINCSDWDIIALAQHHGIATRFLDWTSNSLTALWFSLGRGNKSYEETGASEVCLLETVEADFVIPEDERSPIPDKRGSKTVIFTPQLIDSRIPAQDSYLMRQVYEHLDADNDKLLDIRPVDENPTFKDRVHKIYITQDTGTRSRLLDELEEYGYKSSRILPDANDWEAVKAECDKLVAFYKNIKED